MNQRFFSLFPSELSKLPRNIMRGLYHFRAHGFRSLFNRINVYFVMLSRRSESVRRNDYSKWLKLYNQSDCASNTISECEYDVSHTPLFSIILPVYNPKSEWLEECINSVLMQTDHDWELCIADDASTNPEIKCVLAKFAAKDSRVKVVYRNKNGHISAASNSALELARGTWIVLLDHDDLLSQHALKEVRLAIDEDPRLQLIYSDEDKIDESSRRLGPYFKPDWNRDLFYSHNMISHLGIYKRALVHSVGGFRLGFEGSQDYDLALRCIEQIQDNQIGHISKVLYHWRIHSGSTAGSADAKPYAMLAGQRALNDHFARIGNGATSELTEYGYRTRFPVSQPDPKVSVIIPTRNGLSLLARCIGSILEKTKYNNYEIIIVDNGSDDPETLKYLFEVSKSENIRVLREDSPFNYSALNNLAASEADGILLCLMNNDVEVINEDWMREMVSHALRPSVGAVGAKLLYPDGTIQHAGIICGVTGIAGHSHRGFPGNSHGYFSRPALTSNFSAVTGACLMVRRELYIKLGGLNEIELKVAFNDVDFCLRCLDSGYVNVYTPYALLFHHESATRGYENTPEKLERLLCEANYMQTKWKKIIDRDPAYNPNLTLAFEDFSLAWPPKV